MPASSTTDLLQMALALHRRGAIAEAAAIYAQVQRADPNNADAPYYLATISCQQGRFTEGAGLARSALAIDPRHARAHILLGRALSALGENEDALSNFDCALVLAPDLVQAHSHRADVLSELGRNVEAIASYDRALAAAPDAIEDWFNRGAALAAVGRHRDALSSFDRVIAARPTFAPAQLQRAKALSDLQRHEEALKAADQALAIEPRLAEAWLGRGHVLAALGHHRDALAAYDKSLELKPDFDQAWIGRGNVFIAAGRPELALAAALRALELNETTQTRILFARTLTFAGAAGAPAAEQNYDRALRALSEAWIRPRDLVGVCVDLIKRNSVVSEAIARANAAWPRRLPAAELCGPPGIAILAKDVLLCRLLECAPVADIELERVLTNVRQLILCETAAGIFDEGVLEFCCALARQCFINGYVFAVGEAECERIRHLQVALESALQAGEQCPSIWPAVVGSYVPLHELARAEALLDRSWPPSVAAVITQQVREPAEERRLAAATPCLTEINREVSQAVRAQYEENPYPRWTAAGPPARPAILDICEPDQMDDVLIAGCGTGLVTLEFARQAPQARFLAVDLSLASIGYAKRMAQTLRVTNVAFAQADIMEMGSIGREFDVIETSGVLHHLADPWAGWKILLGLLRPSGVMQVGLYSELARQNVVKARALIAERGYQPNPNDIRRCREEIMASDEGALLRTLTNVADFFTTDDCRDLLFHVQEHRMMLPDIKAFIAANDLEFVGFALDPSMRQLFTARFPDPAALTDLDCWHAFETEMPQTFMGMYQFGVRKRGARPQ
jgi:tetratricopeptide (TPR) repeat protein/2-polyprenyl-3-methyl-5-hydroxy-6-metoxy-1,4-benzoquinol methylase